MKMFGKKKNSEEDLVPQMQNLIDPELPVLGEDGSVIKEGKQNDSSNELEELERQQEEVKKQIAMEKEKKKEFAEELVEEEVIDETIVNEDVVKDDAVEEGEEPEETTEAEVPKEYIKVVKELPVQHIRRVEQEDGTVVNLITVEEALEKIINLE